MDKPKKVYRRDEKGRVIFIAGKTTPCDICKNDILAGVDRYHWNRKRGSESRTWHFDCAEKAGLVVTRNGYYVNPDNPNDSDEMDEPEPNFTPFVPDEGEQTPVVKEKQNLSDKDSKNLFEQFAQAIKIYLPEQTVNEEQVKTIVRTELEKVKILPTRIEILTLDGQVKDMGFQHKEFKDLLLMVQARCNVWLTGPCGSGKTTAAEKVAEALNLEFDMIGKQTHEYNLLPGKDFHGNLIRSGFMDRYEFGGVYLFDEVDGWGPDAAIALNGAIANGQWSFGGRRVKKHPDFVCIAAANTYGMGGTYDYVGRHKQDAAFLDRFGFQDWPIDESLETHICGNPEWAARVQSLRKKAADLGLKVIISPRASIEGAKLLAVGMPQHKVEQRYIRKGMTQEQWQSLQ